MMLSYPVPLYPVLVSLSPYLVHHSFVRSTACAERDPLPDLSVLSFTPCGAQTECLNFLPQETHLFLSLEPTLGAGPNTLPTDTRH